MDIKLYKLYTVCSDTLPHPMFHLKVELDNVYISSNSYVDTLAPVLMVLGCGDQDLCGWDCCQ